MYKFKLFNNSIKKVKHLMIDKNQRRVVVVVSCIAAY